VVGLEVEKEDYIEEMDESAASSSKPVADEIESIRSKLSAKKSAKSSSKSKPIETADLDEDDESLTESERKRAEVILSNRVSYQYAVTKGSWWDLKNFLGKFVRFFCNFKVQL